MATYNGEKFIREQIDSIMNQDFQEFLLVISDDGSNDGTLSIIREAIQKYPEQIVVLDSEKTQRGPCGNFTFLLENAPDADCYFFSDQDDIWDKNKISKSIAQLCRYEDWEYLPMAVFSDYSVVDAVDHFLFNVHPEMTLSYGQRLFNNNVPGCALMFNKALLKLLRFPIVCNMHDWWVILVASSFGRLVKVSTPLVHYRQHENNVCGQIELTFNQRFLDYVKNYHARKEHSRRVVSQMLEFLSRYETVLPEGKRIVIETVLDAKVSTLCTYMRKFPDDRFPFKERMRDYYLALDYKKAISQIKKRAQ
jgi:glycosyltransferase involved in cell wall biosynthesis